MNAREYAIDSELDGYPFLLAFTRQTSPFEQGSVTVYGPPYVLPPADDIQTSNLHRVLVQRAIYRAGNTTRVEFMTGDPITVVMTGEPELHRGLSAVVYVSPAFEATLRNDLGMPAIDHNVITSSTRWNSSVVSGFPLVTHQCTLCRQIAGKKCSACASYYCSKECQRKDWKRHKTECLVKRKSEERT